MSTSIVKVYNDSRGRYEPNARVVLEWNGIVNLGQSSAVNTDSSGSAAISHSASGTATVYVNGKNVGTMKTPGSTTVHI